MPLRFGRQRLPCPASIRAGLGLADIHWPVQRQRDFVEHGAAIPTVASAAPKDRMENAMRGSPLPILFRPAGRILVAPRRHKIKVLTVRHFILVDCERRYVDGLRFIFVVPTKRALIVPGE